LEILGKYFIQCSRCGGREFILSRMEGKKVEELNLNAFTITCSKCGSVNEADVKAEEVGEYRHYGLPRDARSRRM